MAINKEIATRVRGASMSEKAIREAAAVVEGIMDKVLVASSRNGGDRMFDTDRL